MKCLLMGVIVILVLCLHMISFFHEKREIVLEFDIFEVIKDLWSVGDLKADKVSMVVFVIN